jgi:hypothetical protein
VSVSRTRLTDDADRQRLATIIHEWATPWLATETLTHVEEPDVTSESPRWLLRFRGEERDYIAVWLTWRQRTLHVETELMPAPEENVQDIFRYVLVKNAEIYPLHVALGPEDGLYLVGRFPVAEITVELLDEITGAAVHFVDELFPTVMSLGFPSLYRRRRRR